jgi:hypothetical protein
MRLTYSILTSLLLVTFLGCKAEETNIETATTLPPPMVDTVAPTAQPETVTTTTATTATTTATTTGEQPAAAPASKLPKTHTVDHGGVMHAPGAGDNPTQKCGACHGRDLKGSKTGPSCFDCHDQMWE